MTVKFDFSPDNLQDVNELREEMNVLLFTLMNKESYSHLDPMVTAIIALEWCLWGFVTNGHKKEDLLIQFSKIMDTIEKEIETIKNDPNL